MSELPMSYVTLKIPKPIAREIDELLNQGNTGYTSRADFVKTAIRILLREQDKAEKQNEKK